MIPATPTPAWVEDVRRRIKERPRQRTRVLMTAKASGTVEVEGETIEIVAGAAGSTAAIRS